MKQNIRLLLVVAVSLFAPLANTHHHATHHPAPKIVAKTQIAPHLRYVLPLWAVKNHACEEGPRGWHIYPWGGLGIAPSAWIGFGGRQFAPLAYQATIPQQVIVRARIAHVYGFVHQNYPRSC